MHTPLIAIEDITVRFGGLTAVNRFAMNVQRGAIHALIGPNGAGKSTVFNCISRIYQPAEGRIVLDGEDITGLKPHVMAGRGVARTFQNLELFNELSVLENVMLGAYSRCDTSVSQRLSVKPKATLALAEEILENTGLTNYRHTKASGLDFGHQKLLEVARALAVSPRLLLLDEPAAGLRIARNREAGPASDRPQQVPRHHYPPGRARDAARHVDLGPDHRVELRGEDRGRDSVGGEEPSARHRGVSRHEGGGPWLT